MNREAFLAAIRDSPDDDTHRLVFADWLEERGEQIASARTRWWGRVRQRLRDEIRMEGSTDFLTPGTALVMADDWRWRLGCLAAIWTGECLYTPWFDPAPWPEGWSADRFLSVLQDSRYMVEAVALAVLPEVWLQEARRLAEEAGTAARELVETVPSTFAENEQMSN